MKKQIVITSGILLMCSDLFIKYLIKMFLVSQVTIIPNFFYLNYTENYGAAWGIFDGRQIFLIIVSLFCLFILLKEIITKQASKLVSISYILILGGLLGNLFDRIFYGYVTDYLQFIFVHYSFPIFNLADVFIVIGIFLLMIEMIRGEKNAI